MRSRKLPTSGVYAPTQTAFKDGNGPGMKQQAESAPVNDTPRLPVACVSHFTPVPSVNGDVSAGGTHTEPGRRVDYHPGEMRVWTGTGAYAMGGGTDVASAGATRALVSEEMLVDHNYVPMVIGKKGANINRIKEANCASLSFLNDKRDANGLVPLLIRAPTIEQVQQARLQVEEILARCQTFNSGRVVPSPPSLHQSSQPPPLMAAEVAPLKYTPMEGGDYATGSFTPLRDLSAMSGGDGDRGEQAFAAMGATLPETTPIATAAIDDAPSERINSYLGATPFNSALRQPQSHFDGSRGRVGLESAVREPAPPNRNGAPGGMEAAHPGHIPSVGVVEPSCSEASISLNAFKETVVALTARIDGLKLYYERELGVTKAANLALQQKLDLLLQSSSRHPAFGH